MLYANMEDRGEPSLCSHLMVIRLAVYICGTTDRHENTIRIFLTDLHILLPFLGGSLGSTLISMYVIDGHTAKTLISISSHCSSEYNFNLYSEWYWGKKQTKQGGYDEKPFLKSSLKPFSIMRTVADTLFRNEEPKLPDFTSNSGFSNSRASERTRSLVSSSHCTTCISIPVIALLILTRVNN